MAKDVLPTLPVSDSGYQAALRAAIHPEPPKGASSGSGSEMKVIDLSPGAPIFQASQAARGDTSPPATEDDYCGTQSAFSMFLESLAYCGLASLLRYGHRDRR